MQVACGQCGARYEFDASVIPPGGYDAQCTSCHGVFFVTPEAPQAESVTLSCPKCNAVYQFAASDIPEGGYDAQCTQCQEIFFVGPQGETPAAATHPSAPPHVETALDAEPMELDDMEVMELDEVEPLSLEEYEPPSTGEPAPPVDAQSLAAEPSPRASTAGFDGATPLEFEPAPQRDVPATRASNGDEAWAAADALQGADMLSLSMQLGDPADTDGSAEEDFEAIVGKQRRRRLAVGAVIATLAAAILGLYFLAPVMFDKTIGPLIGVKAMIHPDAVPHFQRGVDAMWPDTREAYISASKHFEAALAVDPQYPDALAMAGLAYICRGADLKEQGQQIYDEGVVAVAELKALQESLKGKKPSVQLQARMDALKERIDAINAKATELFEESGKELATGFELLGQALQMDDRRPLLLLAAGVYYANDPDQLSRARQYLHRMDPAMLSGIEQAWHPFLKGRVARVQKRQNAIPQPAKEAFERALAHTSSFQRARYELASLYENAGEKEQALTLVQEILKNTPAHRKAQAMQERLEAPPRPSVAEAESAKVPSKAKKRVDKRRKQKRRGPRR